MNTPQKGTDGRDVHNELDKKEALESVNETVSGENRTEENRENRRHHEQHGNRKYKLHSNHSSADDQPMTRTDTTP